jgi:MFS family permease
VETLIAARAVQGIGGRIPKPLTLTLLPRTVVPLVVAPLAGIFGEQMPKPLVAVGLTLQAIGLAWIAAVITPTVSYIELVVLFTLSGAGMAMFFAPVLLVVLAAVRRAEERGKRPALKRRSASSAASTVSPSSRPSGDPAAR